MQLKRNPKRCQFYFKVLDRRQPISVTTGYMVERDGIQHGTRLRLLWQRDGGVFVQKDGKNVLYDCGDTFAGTIVTDYLDAIDVKSIDLLIASHAHQDHIGGCVHVLNNMEVKRVYHNSSKARTKTWRQFLKAATLKSQPSLDHGNLRL